MDLNILSRLKTRDAALIYAYLIARFARRRLDAMSYERLASALCGAGLLTSRGSIFTAAVVRTRLCELVDAELVSIEKTNGALFDLVVNALEDASEDLADASVLSPNARFQNDNESETREEKVEIARASREEYIYKNNKINKQEPVLSETRAKERRGASEGSAKETNERPSTDALRTLVDWSAPKIAAFRERVARKCWEREINPDLIDRVAALAILKIDGWDVKQVDALIREAVEAKERWNRMDGRAGRSKIWKTLAFAVKRAFEGAGWRWTPTRVACEPKPKQIDASDANVSERPRLDASAKRPAPSLERYSPSELAAPFEEFSRLVARREGLRALDAQGRALSLRLAARRGSEAV